MGDCNLFHKETTMMYIETERLILRDWEESDLVIFQQMNQDPITMEYFPKMLSYEESRQFYERINIEIKERGYGLYAVEIKKTEEFIGFTGFHYTVMDTDFSPCIEIGWRYTRQAWGFGYATEAANACLNYAKENLNFKEVFSFTSIINKRSENVMKKIGMKKVCNFQHPTIPNGHKLREHVLYKIDI